MRLALKQTVMMDAKAEMLVLLVVLVQLLTVQHLITSLQQIAKLYLVMLVMAQKVLALVILIKGKVIGKV